MGKIAMIQPPKYRTFALFVGTALSLACSDKRPDDPISIGGAGGGGAAGSGTPGGTSGSAGGAVEDGRPPENSGPITPLQPLPASTFVFYRFTVEPPENKTFVHLWSYDVPTRQERLISKLDNAKKSLRTNAGDRLAISPDRKWIAFSANFRPSKEDDFLGPRTAMIWKMAVDGSESVRISAPLTDWRPVCSATCDPLLACEPTSNRCTPGGWTYGFEHPSWAPDGRTILAHLSETACKNSSCLPSVAFPDDPVISVISEVVTFPDATASKYTGIPRPEGPVRCNTSQAAVSPDGKRLAVSYTGCFGSTAWGLIISDIDGKNHQTVSTLLCNHIEWRADSAAVYCSSGNRLHRVMPDRTQAEVLSGPSNAKLDHFSFSSDGRWLAANVQQDGKTNIHVADLSTSPLTTPNFEFTAVTADGNSAWPSF